MPIKKQLDFIFKQQCLLGIIVLGLGLTFFGPDSFPLWKLFIITVFGGGVLGMCFRLMQRNMLLSSVTFYDYVIKVDCHRQSFSTWRIILIKRLLLTLFCSILVLAVLSLPIWLYERTGGYSFYYSLFVGICYRKMGRFLAAQCLSFTLIKKRALFLDMQNQESLHH